MNPTSSILPSFTLVGERLYFNDLESQGELFAKASIAIHRLPCFAQENIKANGLSFLRYIHWRVLTLVDSRGNHDLVLINIRSAVKRLGLLGFTGQETMDLLNGAHFLMSVEAKILELDIQRMLPKAAVHFQYQIPFLIKANILGKRDVHSFLSYLKEQGKDRYIYQQALKKELSLFYYNQALKKIPHDDRHFLEGGDEILEDWNETFNYESLIHHFLASEKQVLIQCSNKMKERLLEIKNLKHCSYHDAYEYLKREENGFQTINEVLGVSREEYQRAIDYGFQWKMNEFIFLRIQSQFRDKDWDSLFELYLEDIPHLLKQNELLLADVKDFLLFAVNQSSPPCRYARNCVELFYEKKLGISISVEILSKYKSTVGTTIAASYKVFSRLKEKGIFSHRGCLNEVDILVWINQLKVLKNKQSKIKKQTLYFDTKREDFLSPPLVRALQIQADGRLFLHFSKLRKGDSLLGQEANFKRVKISLDLQTGDWVVKQSQTIASPIVNGRGGNKEDVENEININTILGCHEDIVRLIPDSVTCTRSLKNFTDKIRWLTPFYNGGDLLELIQGRTVFLSIEEKCFVAEHLLAAIDFAHREKNVVHRDIKPANILIQMGPLGEFKNIGLADWGLSFKISNIAEREQLAFTLHYISPEQARALVNESVNDFIKANNFPVDLWATGITLYQLFRSPTKEWEPFDQAISWFEKNSPEQVIRDIAGLQEGWLPFSHENSIRGLISALLQPNPKKRLDSAQALKKFFEIREAAVL